MASEPIRSTSVVAAPKDYSIPAAQQIRLLSVTASFIDNGAVGDWLPAVVILDNNGNALCRAVDQGVKVTAGNDAEVSWFPWVRRRGQTGGGCPTPAAVQGRGFMLIGQATGSGPTLTIPIQHCPCYQGTLFVLAASASDDQSKAGAPLVWTITDTQGGSWSPVGIHGLGGHASIGDVDDGALHSGITGLTIGPSAQRQINAAHTLTTADTITIGWEPGFTLPEPSDAVAFAILAPGVADVPIGQTEFGGADTYDNGDSYPSNGASPNLNWNTDFGGTVNPNPVANSVMLVAVAGYPSSGPWTPLRGSVIATTEIPFSFTVTAQIVAEAGVDIEPGGSWAGAPDVAVGNYQFAAMN